MRQVPGQRLWIGTAADKRDAARLLEIGIEAIVDLAWDEPATPLPRELVYCRFPCVDSAGNPPWLLHLALTTIGGLLANSMRTLVCCGAGMSRSPALAAMALHRLSGRPPEECLQELATLGPLDVSPGFWRDVIAAGRTP